MQNKNKIKTNGGAAMMILVMFFVFISLTILIGIVTPVVREFKIASDNFKSKQSYFLAESGIEDVAYRMKNGFPFESNNDLFLGTSSTTTTVTDLGSGRKQISSLADTDSHQRKVDVDLTTTTGVSFNYGIQVGRGGFELDGTGTVNGNIYANGPIVGDSQSIITGTAISADSPTLDADQSNGSGNPQNSINLGRYSGTQDVAQSFKVSESSPLNEIQFYIKRTSLSPANATVKILTGDENNPGSTVLAQGTLNSSYVSTNYGWVDVSFTTNPMLNADTIYWWVIDASNNSSRYYQIGASNGGYANGVAKTGTFNSSWTLTNPANLDFYFRIYLGGFYGSINGVGTVSGTAQAREVNNTNASGIIYCQYGSGNNKPCTSQPDPTYINLPISEGNITSWEEDALIGNTYVGNYSVGSSGGSLGPKKIQGDLSVSSHGVLTLTGTVWVTGNLSITGNGEIKLDSSYGTNDGVIIVDGTINIGGGGFATGSGADKSYIMLLSKSYSTSAISITGGAGAVIAYAPNGTITLSGGASLNEATGYRVVVNPNTSISYQSGLTNNKFTSGPSGSWSIDSWEEVE